MHHKRHKITWHALEGTALFVVVASMTFFGSWIYLQKIGQSPPEIPIASARAR